MKYAKLLMIVMSVVLILSFTISSVKAQGQMPPVGEVDEDGDVITGVFPQVDVGTAQAMAVMEDLGGFIDLTPTDGMISVDAVPIHPNGHLLFGKYPTFVFSKDAAALKYQIAVWDIVAEPDVLLYTFKGGAGNCVVDECALTPTTALKPLTINGNKGIYFWRVRSKTFLGWGDWSDPALFFLAKNGFKSTFSTVDSKWLEVYGDWVATSAGYAKTKGVEDAWSSLIEKHYATENYVYEVMMKRKTVDDPGDTGSASRIYFLAAVNPGTANSLFDGYAFAYTNDGSFSLWRRDDGVATSLISWTQSAYINPEGWNKLTVMTDYPWIDLWINEHWLGYITISDDPTYYQAGYVGVEMYESAPEKSPLLVDWARLEYTYTFPYAITTGVDGLRDPAYDLTISKDISVGSEFSSR